MLVPVTLERHAGMCGTNEVFVLVVDAKSTDKKDLEDVIDFDEYTRDHAESYGIYLTDDGYEDEDGESCDPECYILGVYNPEEHDCLRAGGGSFMVEEEVQEAYDNLRK